ncbi:rhodanese-related sulfurtransferase [Thiogranum longum]|uniref:Rhodanese-related sulfurtransferase n=1 Tax=Thiogranum longum TaxID=1537524 RepID=A0A4R1H7W5_9GAMM|nr:rhodanese-like domain-containing protein [Thiogranum longum]TCK17924.1 rhodanese-related sulfurtransferase [Thiogranum longum]
MFRKIAVFLIGGWLISLASPLLAESVPESIDGTTRVIAEDVIELVSSNPDVVIIDARKSSDREKGFIEGSIGLPDTETTEASLASHIPSRDSAILFYCNGEKCGRSVKSAKMAVALGYKNVYWFRGGWAEWMEKGYPVAK